MFVFNTYEEALQKEKEIVTEEFIKRPDTYNVAQGGGAGLVPQEEIEVHQYDLTGKYLKTYRSISDAGRKNNISGSAIHSAIISKGIAVNSYWSETKKENLNVEQFKKKQVIKVYYYDKQGNFVGESDSMSALAKSLDACLSSVQKAVRRGILCKNYYICTEKVEKYKPKKYTRKRNVPIYQYDLNGNFIQEFENQNAARRALNKKMPKLTAAIMEKYKYENFFWSYEKLDKFPIKENKAKQVAQYDLDGNLIKI